jgi:ribokinase
LGPKTVVATLGERGSICVWHKEVFYFPSLSVKAVDTTGSGDIFHGAYIFGLLKKWNPIRCIRLATTTAALSCLAIGGRAGIPTREEALEQLKVLAPPMPLATMKNLEKPDKRP